MININYYNIYFNNYIKKSYIYIIIFNIIKYLIYLYIL